MSLPKPVTKTGTTFLDENFEDLIQARADDIASLKTLLESLSVSLADYDDIALVRYLLGFGTPQHTAACIQAAEHVKSKKADVLAAAATNTPLECASRIEPYQKCLAWRISRERALYVICPGKLDASQLLKRATLDEIADYMLWLARCVWLWVDQTSRSLGRIKKYDVVVDFFGYDFTSWEKIPPSNYRNTISQVAEMTEVLHPLAQGFNTIIGLPGGAAAKRMLRLANPLLPKSMTPTQICSGNRLKQPISACPYIASQYGNASHLPDFMDSSCPVTGNMLTREVEVPLEISHPEHPQGAPMVMSEPVVERAESVALLVVAEVPEHRQLVVVESTQQSPQRRFCCC